MAGTTSQMPYLSVPIFYMPEHLSGSNLQPFSCLRTYISSLRCREETGVSKVGRNHSYYIHLPCPEKCETVLESVVLTKQQNHLCREHYYETSKMFGNELMSDRPHSYIFKADL